jgi:hypothetical protein
MFFGGGFWPLPAPPISKAVSSLYMFIIIRMTNPFCANITEEKVSCGSFSFVSLIRTCTGWAPQLSLWRPARRSQEQPGAVSRSQQEPGGSSPQEPGGSRRSQEQEQSGAVRSSQQEQSGTRQEQVRDEAGAVRSSQQEPGGSRRSQELGGARRSQDVFSWFPHDSNGSMVREFCNSTDRKIQI